MTTTSYQRKRRSQRRQRRQRRQQRGGDASNWASGVYGAAGTHTATPGMGNLIAAHNLSGVNMCTGSSGVAANAALVTGGNPVAVVANTANTAHPVVKYTPTKGGAGCNQRLQQGGKGILTDVAVPAVLLYANHMVKPRRGSTKKNKRRRLFSRKFRRY